MSSVSENERSVALTLPHLSAMLRAATAVLGAQEAIARAWKAWSTFRDEQAMRSWLLRITVNGVWTTVPLGYMLPDKIVPFAPDEAWIVTTQRQLLYQNGAIVSFDQSSADLSGDDVEGTNIITPQNGWLLEVFQGAIYQPNLDALLHFVDGSWSVYS